MSNLFDHIVLDKIASAQLLKEGKNKERIREKLKSLQNDLVEIDVLKQNIRDEPTYNKYKSQLNQLIENTIEQITAPNVEDFIVWVNEITKNINQKGAGKLKDYLVKNYTDEINNKLEVINEKNGCLNIEKSLFQKLLNHTRSALSKTIVEIIDKPEELANNISGFLDLLSKRLTGLSEIKELYITEKSQLYLEWQFQPDIDGYDEIISLLLEINQSLKPINESESSSILSRVQKRISDIKSCFHILSKTGIKENTDPILKKIFFNFKEDMIRYDGTGIKSNLEDFLDKNWMEIEQNYLSIKSFFDERIVFVNNPEWDQFINGSIKPIILEYNEILKDPLPSTLITYKSKGISDVLSKKGKKIIDFMSKIDILKANVIQEFSDLISEYRGKNIPLLENLGKTNSNLNLTIKEIEEQLEGLENGKNDIGIEPNFLNYLKEKFTYDLASYNEITVLFKKALQESGKTKHLAWLESKLNGAENGELSEEDFCNPDLIKDLLSIDLIKISIKKQF